MGEIIWNIYLLGTPLGFFFGWLVTLEPERYENPQLFVVVAFLGWPIVVPFVIWGFIEGFE